MSVTQQYSVFLKFANILSLSPKLVVMPDSHGSKNCSLKGVFYLLWIKLLNDKRKNVLFDIFKGSIALISNSEMSDFTGGLLTQQLHFVALTQSRLLVEF